MGSQKTNGVAGWMRENRSMSGVSNIWHVCGRSARSSPDMALLSYTIAGTGTSSSLSRSKRLAERSLVETAQVLTRAGAWVVLVARVLEREIGQEIELLPWYSRFLQARRKTDAGAKGPYGIGAFVAPVAATEQGAGATKPRRRHD